MGAVDHMKFDLALVTTYLPIVSLCSRATILVCTLYFLRDSLQLPLTTNLMLAACLVFLDWLIKHKSVFTKMTVGSIVGTCSHIRL